MSAAVDAEPGGRQPAGVLALVGGAEFGRGNEAQDRLLADAGEPAYIVATAAARQQPGRAVATAARWFATLGLAVEELPVRTRSAAGDATLAQRAATGRFYYLAGGDPGLVVTVLRESRCWEAIRRAWHAGAALAGSSAGAMAFGEWTLLREGWPDRTRRRWAPALGLLPGVAVIPHLDTFGERWMPSVQESRPSGSVLLGLDERTAAVFTESGWRALGPGRVVVWDGDRPIEFRSGDRVEGLPAPS